MKCGRGMRRKKGNGDPPEGEERASGAEESTSCEEEEDEEVEGLLALAWEEGGGELAAPSMDSMEWKPLLSCLSSSSWLSSTCRDVLLVVFGKVYPLSSSVQHSISHSL